MGEPVSTMADDRSSQTPVAVAVFEVAQGGSCHNASTARSRARDSGVGAGAAIADVTGEWESLPAAPTAPRCD
eukprot:5644081-Alexandrium_andersonii.AAC.1